MARRRVDAHSFADTAGAGERRERLVGVVGEGALVQGVEGGVEKTRVRATRQSGGVPPRVSESIRIKTRLDHLHQSLDGRGERVFVQRHTRDAVFADALSQQSFVGHRRRRQSRRLLDDSRRPRGRVRE